LNFIHAQLPGTGAARFDVIVIGLAAVPFANIVPYTSIAIESATRTSTPGSMVRVAAAATVRLEVTMYGLPATDQVVFVEIVPLTLVAMAGVATATATTTVPATR
jgi:hypothetical protein